MTHASNIPVSHQLEETFAKARTEGGIRFIKVVIQDESLIPVSTHPFGASFQSDFEKVAPLFEPKSPSYVIFRLDTQNATGHEWLLISWVPDGSTVKDRMLYASTRDSLKKQLGKNYFVQNDMFGSELDEFTWDAYQDMLKKPFAPAPLTGSEMHALNEATAEIDHGSTREYVHSVRFPLSSDASNALQSFSASKNFVQLKVDPNRETIELVSAKKISVSELAHELDRNEPRFTFFKYTHTFKGESIDSNVFIYSNPDNSPIKLRMLYSTVKSVVSAAAEESGIIVERNGKIEADDPSEVTAEYLNSALHPVKEQKKGFARPARPGKGGARLIKKD